MTNHAKQPLVIWSIQDGKPGHESQSQGLVDALAERRPVTAVTLRPVVGPLAVWQWLVGRFSPGRGQPAPDLIVGAGHGTHLSLLAARRAFGGHAVVLMKPSLPCRWFDLCVVPEHDAPAPADNVFVTRGVLNRMRAGAMKDPRQGLMLIGGASRHYGWNDAEVVRQVRRVVQHDPAIHWTLTTSRRTPASFLNMLDMNEPNLTVVPVEQTEAGWLPARLSGAAWVWVTEDSVSMIYESLTAGAGIGLLGLPDARDSRVVRGVQGLVRDGLVKPFSEWERKPRLALPSRPFNEAARCAEEILRRW